MIDFILLIIKLSSGAKMTVTSIFPVKKKTLVRIQLPGLHPGIAQW